MDDQEEQQLINDEIERTAFERWFWDKGMYIKDDKAARKWLVHAGNELLENGVVHPVLRIFLGQALRNAGLCKDNTAAKDSLVNSLGLGNQKERSQFNEQKLRKFLQEARLGTEKGVLAKKYHIGKNEVKKILAPFEKEERELLDKRLSHTVGLVLRILYEEERGYFTVGDIKDRLKACLTPQFRLVTHKIEDHIIKAIELANSENLILIHDEHEGDQANIFRNI